MPGAGVGEAGSSRGAGIAVLGGIAVINGVAVAGQMIVAGVEVLAGSAVAGTLVGGRMVGVGGRAETPVSEAETGGLGDAAGADVEGGAERTPQAASSRVSSNAARSHL